MEPLVFTTTTYSSKQLATAWNVGVEAIRSQKSRKKALLEEGIDKDWFSGEAGATLWTQSGAMKMAEWIDSPESKVWRLENEGVAKFVTTECGADAGDLQHPQETLQLLADEIAVAWVRQQLPGAVVASLRRMLQSPSQADQQRLQSLLHEMRVVIAIEAVNEAFRFAAARSRESLQLPGGSNVV